MYSLRKESSWNIGKANQKSLNGSELLSPFCLTDQSLEPCACLVFCVLNYNIWQEKKKIGVVFDPQLKQTEKIPS